MFAELGMLTLELPFRTRSLTIFHLIGQEPSILHQNNGNFAMQHVSFDFNEFPSYQGLAWRSSAWRRNTVLGHRVVKSKIRASLSPTWSDIFRDGDDEDGRVLKGDRLTVSLIVVSLSASCRRCLPGRSGNRSDGAIEGRASLVYEREMSFCGMGGANEPRIKTVSRVSAFMKHGRSGCVIGERGMVYIRPESSRPATHSVRNNRFFRVPSYVN